MFDRCAFPYFLQNKIKRTGSNVTIFAGSSVKGEFYRVLRTQSSLTTCSVVMNTYYQIFYQITRVFSLFLQIFKLSLIMKIMQKNSSKQALKRIFPV